MNCKCGGKMAKVRRWLDYDLFQIRMVCYRCGAEVKTDETEKEEVAQFTTREIITELKRRHKLN